MSKASGIITILIILLTSILLVFVLTYKCLGHEYLNGTLKADFQNETAEYTESYNFDNTASVEPNYCNTCLRLFSPGECLDSCEVIYE